MKRGLLLPQNKTLPVVFYVSNEADWIPSGSESSSEEDSFSREPDKIIQTGYLIVNE